MTCNTCNECNPCEKDKKTCCELKVIAWDCVDVEEVDGQYVVSATCPPKVVEWEWIRVEEKPSTEEWYSIEYTVHAKDNKVWVCTDDDNPWTLDTKVRVESPLTRKVEGCGSSNGYLLIGLDTSKLKTPDEKVAVEQWCDAKYLRDALKVESNLIQASVTSDCTLKITDKATTFYDNNVCLWFYGTQDFSVDFDAWWDSVEPKFATWNLVTWNENMKSRNGIVILEDWYYRIFWQLTVQNNIWNNRYINLWRWLLRITSTVRPRLQKAFLSTAKHWQYAVQVWLRWGTWISVNNNGEISLNLDEEWAIVFEPGDSQEVGAVQGPWATFNMDAYVDLKKGEVITLWYRPQTDMREAYGWRASAWKWADFRFVWLWDSSTEYQWLFWGCCVWVQMLSPKTYQWNDVVHTF